MGYRLETERLRLREYSLDDVSALQEILGDPETMAHYPAPYDAEACRDWIIWNLTNYAQGSRGLLAIELKETGEFIGDCGVTNQKLHGEQIPEIGYHIRKDKQRRGYATEAARAVLHQFFKHSDEDILYALMKYTNLASQRTASSLGMSKVDEFPETKNGVTYVYAMKREEWLNRLNDPEALESKL